MSKNHQYGSTVRLECTFYSYDNQVVNPQSVKLTIYNYKYEIIDTFSVPTPNEKGMYIYDYVTEEREGRFYYEWHGTYQGNPYLKRGILQTRFI